MNYLAHCFLAQTTTESIVGNLLGDFCKGFDEKQLYKIDHNGDIALGLANHRAVDKFTDQHGLVKEAKTLFSAKRKRFAGIALDVLFDHYLIKHWALYSEQSFDQYKSDIYALIEAGFDIMPVKMQSTMRSVVMNDWFSSYQTLEGVCYAIDRIAKRVRFKNEFSGCFEDINQHDQALEAIFLEFFPKLQRFVQQRK